MEDVNNGTETPFKEWEAAAEGGSVEHQRKLGLHYLNQYELGNDADTNAELATKWLIRASRTGDEEATEALRKCLQQNIGITPGNKDGVQRCLTTPSWEKQARVAAAAMFHTINSSKNDIPCDEYRHLLDNVTSSRREHILLEKAGKSLGGQPLTEKAFVEHIIHELQGKGTTMFSTLMVSNSEATSKAHKLKRGKRERSNLMEQAMEKMDSFLVFVATQGLNKLKGMIPTKQISVLLNILYGMLSTIILLHALPMITFYISLVVMLCATLQMAYNSLKSRDIYIHTRLLKKFDPRIDSDIVLSSFSWDSLAPHIVFFISLLIFILSHSVANKAWVLSSLLTIVAIFAAVACISLMCLKYDKLLFLSVGFNLGASLPFIVPAQLNIPVLGSILRFLCHPWFSIHVGKELQLHLGLPSILYLMIPFLLVRMAMQHSWRGAYLYLAPHLVCLFWWHVGLMLYQRSTLLELSELLFIWWGMVVLAIPIMTIGAILGAVVLLIYWLVQITTALQIVLALVVVIAIAGLTVYTLPMIRDGQLSVTGASKRNLKLILLSLILVLAFMFVSCPTESEEKNHISWDDYKRLCSRSRWDNTNTVRAQVRCYHLKGTLVSWSGKVKRVVVKSVRNQMEDALSRLPGFIRGFISKWVRCTYGVKYGSCEKLSEENRDICKIKGSGYCHLNHQDEYTFELWVTMQVNDHETQDLLFDAGHEFREAWQRLNAGQEISFNATLGGELGNAWPEFTLHQLQTKESTDEFIPILNFQPQESCSRIFIRHAKEALHEVLNFFLAPLLQFGSPVDTKRTQRSDSPGHQSVVLRAIEALHEVLNIYLAPLLRIEPPVNTKRTERSVSHNNGQ